LKFSFPEINSRQRSGLLILALIIIAGEVLLWTFRFRQSPTRSLVIDSLSTKAYQSLYQQYEEKQKFRIYPFNPNYLSDYKAYLLGIDTPALARIRRFRHSGKFFHSKEQFRQVAGLSDSLFRQVEPYIRIPVFPKRKTRAAYAHSSGKETSVQMPPAKQDINTATAEDLKKVYGIGEVLSRRIVKYRSRLGGFTIREQLKDVYALSDQAYENLWQRFEIKTPKTITRLIPLNTAPIDRLSQNPYIDFDLAEKIVEYRSLHGDFRKMEDLKKVEGFPSDKYRRIILYLRLN